MVSLPNNAPLRGIYINLERSTARRQQLEQQLDRLGLRHLYQRFQGLDGESIYEEHKHTKLSPGSLGCWLSHRDALRGDADNDNHLHILEDDVQITEGFRPFLKTLIGKKAETFDWDIIFTDIGVRWWAVSPNDMRQLLSAVNHGANTRTIGLYDASITYAASMASYIVNKNSKQKVASLLEDGFGSSAPIDIYMGTLITEGRIKAHVTLPFVTTLSELHSESTIKGDLNSSNPTRTLSILFRRSLAYDVDTNKILHVCKDRMESEALDDRSKIYIGLMAHLFSGEARSF